MVFIHDKPKLRHLVTFFLGSIESKQQLYSLCGLRIWLLFFCRCFKKQYDITRQSGGWSCVNERRSCNQENEMGFRTESGQQQVIKRHFHMMWPSHKDMSLQVWCRSHDASEPNTWHDASWDAKAEMWCKHCPSSTTVIQLFFTSLWAGTVGTGRVKRAMWCTLWDILINPSQTPVFKKPTATWWRR